MRVKFIVSKIRYAYIMVNIQTGIIRYLSIKVHFKNSTKKYGNGKINNTCVVWELNVYFLKVCVKNTKILIINTVCLCVCVCINTYIHTHLITYNFYFGVLVRGWSMAIGCGSFCV